MVRDVEKPHVSLKHIIVLKLFFMYLYMAIQTGTFLSDILKKE